MVTACKMFNGYHLLLFKIYFASVNMIIWNQLKIIEFSEYYFSTDLSTSGNLDKNNWWMIYCFTNVCIINVWSSWMTVPSIRSPFFYRTLILIFHYLIDNFIPDFATYPTEMVLPPSPFLEWISQIFHHSQSHCYHNSVYTQTLLFSQHSSEGGPQQKVLLLATATIKTAGSWGKHKVRLQCQIQ